MALSIVGKTHIHCSNIFYNFVKTQIILQCGIKTTAVLPAFKKRKSKSTRIDPVVYPAEQDRLEEEGKLEKFSPVIAAKSTDSCSVFHDPVVDLFVNHVMKGKCGQKHRARELVDQTLTLIKHKQMMKYNSAESLEEKNEIERDPRKIFHRAIANIRPVAILRSVSRGSGKYRVPVPCPDHKSTFIAMRWAVDEVRNRDRDIKKTVRFPETMSNELLDAANNTGTLVKKKQDLHRQCEANKAYAHFYSA